MITGPPPKFHELRDNLADDADRGVPGRQDLFIAVGRSHPGQSPRDRSAPEALPTPPELDRRRLPHDLNSHRSRPPGSRGGSVGARKRHDVPVSEESAPLVSVELLEQLGDAVTVVGFDWRYRYVSPGAAAVIGRPVDELVGAPVWDVFPDVVGSPEHAAALRAMSERTAVKIVWFFDRVGRWFEQHAIPTPAGLVVVVDDVTDREEEARRADQLLAIGEALAQAMTVADVAAVAQNSALPVLGAAGGALVLVDEAQGVARSTGWTGMDEKVDHRLGGVPADPADTVDRCLPQRAAGDR